MARYVEGLDRHQVTLLPECLEDYIAEDNPVRVVDAFVEGSIFRHWVSSGPLPRTRDGRLITRRCC